MRRVLGKDEANVRGNEIVDVLDDLALLRWLGYEDGLRLPA